MVRVKICGITGLDDALMAAEAGADALGFVFFEKSPRFVTVDTAAGIIAKLPPFVQAVGLFVNADRDFVNETATCCGLDIVQLHGDESPEYCTGIERRVLKAFRIQDATSLEPLKSYPVAGYLLDAYSPSVFGGTGLTFNWDIARVAKAFGPIVLAGGLTSENVQRAVTEVSPWAVDVSSGVEESPGKKDPRKVKEFIRQAKML